MNKYSCKCPVPGCNYVFEEEDSNWERAFKKMFEKGEIHIFENHPDFPEYENREESARDFAMKNMKCKKCK